MHDGQMSFSQFCVMMEDAAEHSAFQHYARLARESAPTLPDGACISGSVHGSAHRKNGCVCGLDWFDRSVDCSID
jgi:hypothetical protein